MNKLEVDIPHRLTRDEARARLERITDKLAQEYSAVCTWEGGERLLVKRKGLQATLTLGDERVHVGLELGMFMRPFAGSIRAGIAKQLTELLA
jgi:putative polyhydroxyalkanoate system protein